MRSRPAASTDPERAPLSRRARTLLTTAATRAEGLGAPEEALANTLAAVALDPDDGERYDLQLRGARVAALAGQPTLAEQLAAAAAGGFERTGDTVGVMASLAQQMWACVQLGRVREGEVLAMRAQGLAAGRDDVPPDVQTEVLGMLVWSARMRGDRAAQQTHCLRVLRLAELHEDPALIIRGLNRLGALLLDLGSASAHRALAERAVVLAREQQLLPALASALTNLVSELYAADLDGSGAPVRESVSVSKQLGDSATIEGALINACYAWFLAGDWDLLTAETAEWLEGRELTATCGPLWLTRVQVQLARGEPVVVPDAPHAEDPYDQQVWSATSALAQAADGHRASAARAAEEASRRTFGDGEPFDDFEVLWTPTVELQLQAGELTAAAELLALAAPYVTGVRARALTRGVVPRLRGLLALARGEDPEPDLREAEAALSSYGAPYLLARTRLELGRWLQEQGRGDEASGLLAQARETFVTLRAAPSVAEVDALVPVDEALRT